MCSFRSCQTRFEFLSQFRKVRNAFECFITQVQTRLPKSKCVWPMKINVICTVPQPSFTRGFLKLAEEARNVYIENEQCFIVDEVLPQMTGMTRPVIEPVSWPLEEKLGQLVKVTREGALRVPPGKFEAGQMMLWPDIKSDGVMIDVIMLESEMSPVGPVRDAAEPVLLAAKSEVFTSVIFAGGSLLRQPPWPW